ncbi:MAG: carboxylating nicotinate-nucleotide diphosphorylase [Parvibaculaceae bacterium]|nr:carboxylating nicotinate-nucleotide diphosphorylase [Parvibaculaceae bacterium]
MSIVDLESLPLLIVEPAVRAALEEDLGLAGDITTSATVPSSARARVMIRARKSGRIAGLDCARIAFRLIDPGLKIAVAKNDGWDVEPGDTVAAIEGSARSILTAERVALNFMGHLSGIATSTREIVRAVEGTQARICCTRKTTPNLRALEKYAVRAGGGINHRFGLDDGVLIKDNHIAMSGGITAAVARARKQTGHMVKIEVEVDNLEQLEECLGVGVEAVLLDNMSPETLTEAVKLVAGRATTEASGNVTAATAAAIAASGVDLISCGWITHSAPCLDLGLDFDELTA